MKELGFREFRVRYHGDLARIEVAPEEFHRWFDQKHARRRGAKIQTDRFSLCQSRFAGLSDRKHERELEQTDQLSKLGRLAVAPLPAKYPREP